MLTIFYIMSLQDAVSIPNRFTAITDKPQILYLLGPTQIYIISSPGFTVLTRI